MTLNLSLSEILVNLERRIASLRRRVEPPAVSVVLRRMCEARRIHQYRRGKANHEALYTRMPPPARKREEIP